LAKLLAFLTVERIFLLEIVLFQSDSQANWRSGTAESARAAIERAPMAPAIGDSPFLGTTMVLIQS
jgi:hypothetical protein